MTERRDMLEALATLVADYRSDELAAPTLEHVERWITQFDSAVQLPILRELQHVWGQVYFSKDRVHAFLSSLVLNPNLAGADPCAYWRESNFLRIQKNGNSQREMLSLFDEILYARCGLVTGQCGEPGGDFIYIDDAMFSGNRVGNDLAAWIESAAPGKAIVHILVKALHTSGEWLVGNRLREATAASGKRVEIKYWRVETIENRKAFRRNAGVLWPSNLPNDAAVADYVNSERRFPFEPRPVGGSLKPFSSEAGRSLLEREFLLAGLRIRGACAHPKDIMRPLGFSPFPLGFGTLMVTYRNCPNNAPLALWWGDPNASVGSPLRSWYPLFPRKTYQIDLRVERSAGGAWREMRERNAADFGFEDE